jgi:O-antigen/teichoic acid export membrane protein
MVILNNNSTNPLIKNSLWNLIGRVLPLIVGIISIPFTVKGLGTDRFGILSIGWVVLGYFGLFDFGLSRSTTKFIAEALASENKINVSNIFWTSMLMSLLLGVLGTIVLLSGTHFLVEYLLKIPEGLKQEASSAFLIISLSLPIVMISASLIGVIAGGQRFDLINKVQIPASIATYTIPSLTFYFSINLSEVLILIVMMRLLAGCTYFTICLKVFPYVVRVRKINKVIFKRLVAFGGWVSVTNIVSPLLVNIDRIVIGWFLSVTSVALYTAPYEMIVRLRILPVAIMNAISPEFSSKMTKIETENISYLFSNSFKIILVLIGGTVSIIYLLSPYILNGWMGQDFRDSSTGVLRILSIGVFFNSLAFVPFVLLQSIGRPDLPAKFHIFEFGFYIFLLIYGVRFLGINGAAIAWTLRVLIDFILLLIAAFRLFPELILEFKEKKLFHTFMGVIIAGFTINISIVNLSDNILLQISKAAILSIFFFLYFWMILMDEKEKYLIYNLLGKLYFLVARKKSY